MGQVLERTGRQERQGEQASHIGEGPGVRQEAPQKANGDYRALLLKYSATGTLLWARTWASPTGSSPSGYRVAIDTKGRVVVVGQLKVKTATHM